MVSEIWKVGDIVKHPQLGCMTVIEVDGTDYGHPGQDYKNNPWIVLTDTVFNKTSTTLKVLQNNGWTLQ